MNIFKKKNKFITIIIDGKGYDYPKDLPIPRIGETIGMYDSKFGLVNDIIHQVIADDFMMITIKTISIQ